MIRKRFSITLSIAPNEMAQEEIGKQIVFICKDISNLKFSDSSGLFEFDGPEDLTDEVLKRVEVAANRVQRSLRSLERKIVYRSAAMGRSRFRGDGASGGIKSEAKGVVSLSKVPLKLFKYFDAAFEIFGNKWGPEPVMTPTLIPARVLAKCDYFRSFPHNVTYACHLPEEPKIIESFRERHANRESLDEQAAHDMDRVEMCLSPAVCYHIYYLNQDKTVPEEGSAYAICGKCFRYESENLSTLKRLWDFTMREVVFLGARDRVLERRNEGIEAMKRFLEEHELAGEIRTASDPFFVAPDSNAKTYFQLSSETKYEISLQLPKEERIAVGSLNYHTDFFGRAFNVNVDKAGYMHSVCIAFGIERWVHAFLAQHGEDPANWPLPVKKALS